MWTGIPGDVFCNQDETLGKPSSKMNRKLAELEYKSQHQYKRTPDSSHYFLQTNIHKLVTACSES